MTFRFHISQYLTRRAADWKAKGFTETLTDWAALNARSKFWGDDQRAAFKNWEEVADPRNPHGQRQGVNERIMLRELLRRADMMVILENKLDALVRLHTPWPPGLIGHAVPVRHRQQPAAGVAVRPERRPDRGADPGGLCHDGLRSGVQAHAGRQALRVAGVRQADDDPGAGPAVLAGVPRRARQGGRAAEDRLGLRGGVAAPRARRRISGRCSLSACPSTSCPASCRASTPCLPTKKGVDGRDIGERSEPSFGRLCPAMTRGNGNAETANAPH